MWEISGLSWSSVIVALKKARYDSLFRSIRYLAGLHFSSISSPASLNLAKRLFTVDSLISNSASNCFFVIPSLENS